LFLLELVAATVLEEDPHPGVFDLLHNALARLDEPEAPVTAVVAYFLWRLLRHVGLSIRTDACVECGRKLGGQSCFCSSKGGLICRDCQAALPERYALDADTRAGLSALAAAEAGQRAVLPEAQARGVGRLLAYHVSQQSGKALKLTRGVFGG
jgi:DNA repair protein RecO